jgi:hypothetical protein
MAKFLIKVWDNFNLIPGDEDSYEIIGQFQDIESAINIAKNIVSCQINHSDNMKLEEIIDQYRNFGQDPVIYNIETGESVGAFNSIAHITEIYNKSKDKEYQSN